MQIIKAPLRISFFGGGTDVKNYYTKYGSMVIGTTIDKYVYVSLRKRPSIVSNQSIISYSKQEITADFSNIENPLIRETLIHENIKDAIDLHNFSDIPSRSGLGGSSACCVALLKALRSEFNCDAITEKELAKDAIQIEREILKDSGGLQDQIWSTYGGFNRIEIKKNGDFSVKSMPLSSEFKKYFEKCLILVYTGEQRNTNEVAQSYNKKNSEKHKKEIHEIAKMSYGAFESESVERIGNLLDISWNAKKQISPLISSKRVEEIAKIMDSNDVLGKKLCGAGQGGFVLGVAFPYHIEKMKEIFKDYVLPIRFEEKGVRCVYSSNE